MNEAVKYIYADHHGWLKTWLFHRLGNSADAADLTQDIFVRLILRPASRGFSSTAETRAYLRRMASGMCVDLWRRRSLEQAWLESMANQPETLVPSAEQQVMVLEALQEIDRLLHSLPPKAASAFVMAVGCEMTDQEVAHELGVSARMVRKYVAKVMLYCMQLEARHLVADGPYLDVIQPALAGR
ncbi:sigma-70 family RNA polymerase sigma factor [Nitrincola sp.]|uniref:sigma-70 family RNA polymerase sigma factor n=1 Tax=Nitrincola sp. TaxID=1926584 RepID=UPI003A8FFDC5